MHTKFDLTEVQTHNLWNMNTRFLDPDVLAHLTISSIMLMQLKMTDVIDDINDSIGILHIFLVQL